MEKEPGKEADKWRYYELRGPYGYVYPYSGSQLACIVFASLDPSSINRSQRAKKCREEHPDWAVIQSGDTETTFRLDDNGFEDAAQTISARVKRVGNPENALHLAGFWFKSRKNSVPEAV